MRRMILFGVALIGLGAAGCGTSSDRYASLCEREYAENRERAIATGALVGAAAGVALDDDDARGAVLGGALGGALASAATRENDPCGYGFGGYGPPERYGYYDRNGNWVYR